MVTLFGEPGIVKVVGGRDLNQVQNQSMGSDVTFCKIK